MANVAFPMGQPAQQSGSCDHALNGINSAEGIDASEYSCRICLESGTRSDFIAPCSCRGTSKWVHRSCLDKWRSVREDVAFSKCTECLTPYKLKPLHDDSWSTTCHLRCKFYGLVTRDLMFALLMWQAAVCVLGLFVFICDLHGSLLVYFKMSDRVIEFYYAAGLLAFFAVVGLLFTSGNSCGNSQRNIPCDVCTADPMCWWFWNDGIGLTNPHFYCYNCYCAECGANSCPMSVAGGDMCGACGSADCCSCAALGEEMLAVLVVLLILLVAVGVIVSVFVGAMYISFVMQRHVKVLKKWNLAQEFVVMDLSEGDDCDSIGNPLNETSVLLSPAVGISPTNQYSDSGLELHRRVSSPVSRESDIENQVVKPINRELPGEESITSPIHNEDGGSVTETYDYESHPSAPRLTRRQFAYLRASGLL
jgi:hypothetical protein